MTVHTFLAHFIYGEKGLTGQHLLHVDTLHHTIALSPYEKATESYSSPMLHSKFANRKS